MYEKLLAEVKALIDSKADLYANMSNVAVHLHEQLGHHWTGFYRVINNELMLGPFAGPVACTRISYGKGVCGKAWETKATVIVDNVHEFPGHIACSALSNSEIVVPVIINNQVAGVLDIDSTLFGAFDKEDQFYLEQIVACML